MTAQVPAVEALNFWVSITHRGVAQDKTLQREWKSRHWKAQPNQRRARSPSRSAAPSGEYR